MHTYLETTPSSPRQFGVDGAAFWTQYKMIERDARKQGSHLRFSCLAKNPTRSEEEPPAAISQGSDHISHYPLDIPLPFHIYQHRPMAARDIMLHSIMADFMNPSRVKPHTYNAYVTYPAEFDIIRAQDRQLGADLKLMRKMLLTSHYHDPVSPRIPRWQVTSKPRLHMTTWEFSHDKRLLKSFDRPVEGPLPAPPTVGEEVVDLLQRYFFEMDGAVTRLWLDRQKPPRKPNGPKARRNGVQRLRLEAREQLDRAIEQQQQRERKTWQKEDQERLRWLRGRVLAAEEYLPHQVGLYDGGAHLALVHRALEGDSGGERLSRPSLNNYHYTIATRATGPSHASNGLWEGKPALGFFIQPRWSHRRHMHFYCQDALVAGPDRVSGRGRPKTRSSWDDQTTTALKWFRFRVQRPRSHSEPPHGSYCAAKLPEPAEKDYIPGNLMVLFPRLPLSTIDRRTRRRSLSRSHIANMFDWDCEKLKGPEESAAAKEDQKKNAHFTRKQLAKVRKQQRELEQADSSSAPNDHPVRPIRPHPPPHLRPRTPPEYRLFPPCPNCASRGHPLAQCHQPCGYCGAPNPRDFHSVFPTTVPRPLSPLLPSQQRQSHLDPGQEIIIKVSGGHTLIIKGEDKIFLPASGGLDWHCSSGSRDKVVFTDGLIHSVARGVDSLPVEKWYPQTRDLKEAGGEAEEHIVAVEGVGKHSNPHTADKCPVPREKRCKCVEFPQYHTADRCRVLCTRKCGNEEKPGRWGHRNAMGCKSRCCMCGIKGHSGRECRLERCRCGGRHLGQDCGWTVECQVEGCGRFRCGVHCRGCGSTEKPFVEGMCRACGGVEAQRETVGGDVDERRTEAADEERRESEAGERKKDSKAAEGERAETQSNGKANRRARQREKSFKVLERLLGNREQGSSHKRVQVTGTKKHDAEMKEQGAKKERLRGKKKEELAGPSVFG